MRKMVEMKKIVLTIELFISVVLLGGCLAAYVQSPRECQIKDLLVDEAIFPPGAQAGEFISPLPESAVNSAGRTIYLGKGGIANHAIYPYRTARGAAREFNHQKELVFSEPREWEAPWEIPAEVNYESSVADQYYLACGGPIGGNMCNMIAQYEEYYVFFNAHMNPGELGFADLERVLHVIDERMAKCLDG
jgi:hypothetical protein